MKFSFLSKSGNNIKNDREGITIQKILLERLITSALLLVSLHNQIKAIREIQGTEARIPPISELLLDISEMIVISRPEMMNLTIICHIPDCYPYYKKFISKILSLLYTRRVVAERDNLLSRLSFSILNFNSHFFSPAN